MRLSPKSIRDQLALHDVVRALLALHDAVGAMLRAEAEYERSRGDIAREPVAFESRNAARQDVARTHALVTEAMAARCPEVAHGG